MFFSRRLFYFFVVEVIGFACVNFRFCRWWIGIWFRFTGTQMQTKRTDYKTVKEVDNKTKK